MKKGNPKDLDQRDRVMKYEERPKVFDFTDRDPVLDIEATSEYPVMYRALGTEPRTGHPYNVYDDIRTEPHVIGKTLETIGDSVRRVAAGFVKREISHVVGIGMGTSQFVGQSAGPAFWEWSHLTTEDRDSVEALTTEKPYDYEHTALLCFSGSGSTVDTISACKKFTEKGAYSIAITSIAESPLTKITKDTIACVGGFDTGGSDTFHYATRLAASLALAIELGKERSVSDLDFKELESQLKSVPTAMAKRLDEIDKRCWSIAKHNARMRSALIVGTGPNYGTAEEMALKFDEMAHIPAKAMVPTRHLHGALGLTDERIQTIILAPENNASHWIEQIADVTMMLKAPSMAIVPDKEKVISPMMDYVIRVPISNEHLFALYVVPAIQMYPYYCAVEQGDINPDCQRSNIPRYARVWGMILPRGSH
jgi:glucosamine 6-phosphate synthetase-like amidotransferase/phosphosugar isomerase protein